MKSHVIIAASLATAATASNCSLPDKIEQAITTAGLNHTLSSLYDIALANNNTRAFGTPGYRASVDYVLSRAAALGPNISTSVQNFTYIWEHTRSISLLGPDSKSVYVLSPQFNNPTPAGGISAAVAPLPEDAVRGAGCLDEQYTALESDGKAVKGKFALVKKGVCNFSTKAKLATKYGAAGIMFYNTVPGTDYIASTIVDGVGNVVPAGMIPLEVASQWAAQIGNGTEVKATLTVDSESAIKESWNVIAETASGSPNQVVMLGAHLDSVQRGPGMNDDGSGSSALIEIMTALSTIAGGQGGEVKNKVRFAWWGAEEAGLVGSKFYTGGLSKAESDRIRFYFNYDMIASPFPYYAVGKSNITRHVPEMMGDFIKKQGVTGHVQSYKVIYASVTAWGNQPLLRRASAGR